MPATMQKEPRFHLQANEYFSGVIHEVEGPGELCILSKGSREDAVKLTVQVGRRRRS